MYSCVLFKYELTIGYELTIRYELTNGYELTIGYQLTIWYESIWVRVLTKYYEEVNSYPKF
jgi:hypothetical protein